MFIIWKTIIPLYRDKSCIYRLHILFRLHSVTHIMYRTMIYLFLISRYANIILFCFEEYLPSQKREENSLMVYSSNTVIWKQLSLIIVVHQSENLEVVIICQLKFHFENESSVVVTRKTVLRLCLFFSVLFSIRHFICIFLFLC